MLYEHTTQLFDFKPRGTYNCAIEGGLCTITNY
jgi:hypothetical protein